jgi:hypothetical protein
MMSEHSAIVGGSTAGRVLNCPASYQATMALPPSADVPSEYAEEGTAMHAVMSFLMAYRRDDEVMSHLLADALSLSEVARQSIGQPFHDRVLTREHVDTMIEPALNRLAELEALYGDYFEVVGVEQRVKFPGIPGAFGTCDLILRSPSMVLHVDWKFGQGVGVQAVTKDALGERINAQLMFYLVAALSSQRHLYRRARATDSVRGLAVAIIQPRSDPALTHVQVSRKEVRWFAEDLQVAVVHAVDRDPPRAKGEWCRWAPCKVSCPLWTGPMLDLTALGVVKRETADASAKGPTAYGEYLARAKTLVDILAMYTKSINDQLHSYLEDGGQVPGWRLKAKAKQRVWIDENTVQAALVKLGFRGEEIWRKQLVTFASADATAKRLGVEIPDHLRVAPPTSETTIATTDDPAPVIERALAIEAFRASLKALAK